MLHTGVPAPLFETIDVQGKPFKLSDFKGKHILLSFFRNSACAMCNLRIYQMVQQHSRFQDAGIQCVAVFESGLQSLKEHVGRQHAPFPILPDPDAELYRLYGVENSEAKIQATMQRPDLQEHIQAAAAAGFALTHEAGSNFNRMPADILIGPDLRVITAHYARYVYDHLPLEEVFEQVRLNLSL